MNNQLPEAVAAFTIFALVGWVLYLFFRRYQVATHVKSQRIESFNRMIEKFGSAKEFIEFAESAQGKKLLEEPVSPTPNPLNKVLRFLFIMIGTDSVAAICAGAISKVTLTISTNQARNFIVVDDPVPAGLEIVNTSFKTTGSNLAEQEQNRTDWWTWNPFRHRELYDDKALFFADYLPAGSYTLTYLVRATSYGTFQAPATRAEGMYEPEVFGQTSSRLLRVQ